MTMGSRIKAPLKCYIYCDGVQQFVYKTNDIDLTLSLQPVELSIKVLSNGIDIGSNHASILFCDEIYDAKGIIVFLPDYSFSRFVISVHNIE